MKLFRCTFAFAIILALTSSLFATDNIPMKRVVLFNSGVGYFQRDGEVDGDMTVELPFKADQINDLLKSLVLQDLGGGKISPVTYPSRDPLSRILKSFGVDITDNPTLGDLLNRLRGTKVIITTSKDLEGMILGVETQKKTIRDEVIEMQVLNVLAADGLRAIPLEQVQKIKLLDEKMDSELRKALEVLASGFDKQRKPVTLSFTGKGKRSVRVGYILETPVWKTSYRLSLEDKKPTMLQGWAIVENTTDEDWMEVSMALVSGRPISFVQDLYQPLYATRPVVVPELYSSLKPPVYEDELDKAAVTKQTKADIQEQYETSKEKSTRRGRQAQEKAAYDLASPAPSALGEFAKQAGEKHEGAGFIRADGGVNAMAAAGSVGELFQYAIDQPVSIARQKSAMIPIVNGDIETEKVSIYNENVQRKFPLNGLRLKNTTNLHLMQGPITVFDGGVYAGDARIEDLQPKEERLISYAIDLGVEVEPLQKGGSSDMTSIKIVKGTLISTYKHVREKTYTVKSRTDEKRVVLIEHPFEDGWKLVSPDKAPERTQTVYHFRMEVEPRKSASLEVKEEQPVSQQIALISNNVDTIQYYVSSKVISTKVKEALEKLVAMKMKLNEISRKRAEAQQEVNNIGMEQSRIRENMGQLTQNSELYARYVKKFDTQETQIESLREQIRKMQDEENKQRKEMEDYLSNLQVE